MNYDDHQKHTRGPLPSKEEKVKEIMDKTLKAAIEESAHAQIEKLLARIGKLVRTPSTWDDFILELDKIDEISRIVLVFNSYCGKASTLRFDVSIWGERLYLSRVRDSFTLFTEDGNYSFVAWGPSDKPSGANHD